MSKSSKTNFTDTKPLSGKSVLVTRPRAQAVALATVLADLGAEVLLQPAIEIAPTSNWSSFDQAVSELARFSRVVLVSVNAVEFFFARINHLVAEKKLASSDLNRLEFCAIGHRTAKAIEQHGFSVDLVPDDATGADSAGLASLLIGQPTSGSTMIIRADRGSTVLPEALTAARCASEQFAIYRNADVQSVDSNVLRQMAEGEIDWTTITSSAIGRSLYQLFGENLKRTKLVTISPTTTQAIGELGLEAAAEASQYSMHGLVDALVEAVVGDRPQ